MGDLPPGSRPQAMDNTNTDLVLGGNNSAASSTTFKSPDNYQPFYSQFSAIPQGHPRSDFRSPTHPSAHYHPQEHASSPLNMGAIAGALPDYATSDDSSLNTIPQSVPRTLPGASPSAVAYQHGQNMHMSAHASGSVPLHPSYGSGFPLGPYQPNIMPSHSAQHASYSVYGANHSRQGGPTPIQAPYQGYVHTPQYMYYPAPYGSQAQFSPAFIPQGPQAQTMYGRRASLNNSVPGLSGHMMDYTHTESAFAGLRVGQGSFKGDPNLAGQSLGVSYVHASGLPRSGSVNSIPRGPPRKPKQSGHALWVGNLPPGTTVMALKDHFSRDATQDIESLFLISKSNCAFVNYRTEVSCTAAMHRFHDSRFNGVRLVCRLRRSSAPASGVPTGPSAMLNNQQHTISRPATPKQDGVTSSLHDPAVASPSRESNDDHRSSADTTNKYFIVKSLTLQDLELSVRNGIWATQSHNEEALNKAFQTTENVYLIFSANKSGEYFGFARMTSPILEDGSRFVGAVVQPENLSEATDVPKSIPTPATEWAPRGRIIDDSARGTIFWEAELPESDVEEDTTETDEVSQVEGNTSVVAQSWGKPFKIKWISTNRLPFYRTRGLRNPWNANREVKIARDGTELEPSVGERLVQMFHRMGPSATASMLG